MSLVRLVETFRARGDIHHACLLTGEKTSVTKALLDFLVDELNISTKGNPDFHHYEYVSFGIDDGRKLQNFAIQKSLGKYKIFVAAFSTMTREAQNALLKLFEDPKDKTHFFLITDTSENILPTLKSRLFVVDMSRSDSKNIYTKDAENFIKSKESERMKYLKELIELKDKQSIYSFFGAVETFLYEKTKEDLSSGDAGKTKKNAFIGLEEISKSKKYLFDRSSSVKLLLEHVALSVPRM